MSGGLTYRLLQVSATFMIFITTDAISKAATYEVNTGENRKEVGRWEVRMRAREAERVKQSHHVRKKPDGKCKRGCFRVSEIIIPSWSTRRDVYLILMYQ